MGKGIGLEKNRKLLLRIFTLFFTTFTGYAHPSSLTLENSAKNLDAFIQSVSLCGRWQHNHAQGSYRIIHGWLWGHTEIYAQWVADPVWHPELGQKERRTPVIVKTTTFPEINYYESATDLDNIQCLQQNGIWTITADAENAHETPSLKYKLVIYLYNDPGKYKLVENPE